MEYENYFFHFLKVRGNASHFVILFLQNNEIFSLKAAEACSCKGAACASLQQCGFAIAAISPGARPNRKRRLTHELVKVDARVYLLL